MDDRRETGETGGACGAGPRQHGTPCRECPFRRDVPRGMTGGSPPTTYVAQLNGPFLLSCHMTPEYRRDKWSGGNRQCAGAAIMRANAGVPAGRLPAPLLTLPRDEVVVFSSFAEFAAHHAGGSPAAFAALDVPLVRDALTRQEMANPGVRRLGPARGAE